MLAIGADCPIYRRADWHPRWADADRDCQDTRQEVLIAESTEQIRLDPKGCRVLTGRWEDSYTGKVYTNPSDLDIDHVVPLAEAHDSGGYAWLAERQRAFANDLTTPDTLRAVQAGANRSKGARDPAAWLPPNAAFHRAYAQEWVDIKRRWGLSADSAERAALREILGVAAPLPMEAPEARCKGGGNSLEHGGASQAEETAVGEQACCQYCKKGKPCGDSCIAAGRTCRKPPGCAC